MIFSPALAGRPRWVQDLADVHARRHAQRVQHDVDRACPSEVRHVLDRHDRRLTPRPCCRGGRPSCRRLDAALHRHEDLDHLHGARRAGRRPLILRPCRRSACRTPCGAPSGLHLRALDLGRRPRPMRQAATRTSSGRPGPPVIASPFFIPGRHWRSCPRGLRAQALQFVDRGSRMRNWSSKSFLTLDLVFLDLPARGLSFSMPSRVNT